MSPDYIAGLFDGEGYFTIRGCKGLSRHPYRLQGYAHIAMRDEWLLRAATKALGYGSVNANHKPANERHASYACLSISGQSLTRFCEEMGPRLLLKREQAAVMLELRRMKERRGNANMSDADYAIEMNLWSEMRRLNQKGPGRSGVVAMGEAA